MGERPQHTRSPRRVFPSILGLDESRGGSSILPRDESRTKILHTHMVGGYVGRILHRCAHSIHEPYGGSFPQIWLSPNLGEQRFILRIIFGGCPLSLSLRIFAIMCRSIAKMLSIISK